MSKPFTPPKLISVIQLKITSESQERKAAGTFSMEVMSTPAANDSTMCSSVMCGFIWSSTYGMILGFTARMSSLLVCTVLMLSTVNFTPRSFEAKVVDIENCLCLQTKYLAATWWLLGSYLAATWLQMFILKRWNTWKGDAATWNKCLVQPNEWFSTSTRSGPWSDRCGRRKLLGFPRVSPFGFQNNWSDW